MVEEGDQLMAEALRAVKAGQEEVHSKLPKVGKRSSGSHRKHQSSPAYVRMAQEMRMARSIREGRKVSWLIARMLKTKGMGIQLLCLANEGEGIGRRDWLEYARVLEKRAEDLRSRLHGDLRQLADEEAEGWEGVEADQDDGASIRRGRRQRGSSPVECTQEEEGWGSR